jgi:peptidoglycan/LPS O-acetylase OafA/YrhL
LSVIAFHVGAPGISGGFVGVNVFFVISGFLISGLLLAEAEQYGRIQIIDFYARGRILPALTLVVFATLLLGSVVLLPTGEQRVAALHRR